MTSQINRNRRVQWSLGVALFLAAASVYATTAKRLTFLQLDSSLCEMHLDRRLRDLGIGYQIDAEPAYSEEERIEWRQLFDASYAQNPEIRFEDLPHIQKQDIWTFFLSAT